MRIGITYNLRKSGPLPDDVPDDHQEEFDSPETIDALAAVLRGLGLAVNPAGQVYATGSYRGQAVHFEGVVLPPSTAGSADVFVAKMNALGQTLWVAHAGGVGVHRLECVHRGARLTRGVPRYSLRARGALGRARRQDRDKPR